MARRVAFAVLGLLLLVLVLGGIKGLQISALAAQGKSFVPPPEAVTVAPVKVDRWQPQATAVGTVVAVHGVMLSAEASGVVRRIAFASGAFVRRGQLLIEIDRDSERAELRAASAQAQLAAASLKRTRQLERIGARAAADLDTAVAEARQTRAQVGGVRAALAKKTVRAPFAGRLGIRQVSLGEFVANGAPLVSLQSSDPIYVDLSLPQQWLGRLAVGQRVLVTTDAFAGETFAGKLTTIDPRVDPATRNVVLRATLRNAGARLRPGMFVDARLVFPETQTVLTMPATAVLYAPYGDSVFVVEQPRAGARGQARPTVRQQFVRLGETRGDIVAVASGLRAGQQVVTSGAFKLRPGATVDIRSELAPPAELAPDPTDS